MNETEMYTENDSFKFDRIEDNYDNVVPIIADYSDIDNLIDELKKALERIDVKNKKIGISSSIGKKIELKITELLEYISLNNASFNKQHYESMSIQHKVLYWRIYKDFYDDIRYITEYDDKYFLDDLKNIYNSICSGFNKISNIDKLNIISNYINQGIVIIGGNGSGKSSFVSFLKNIYRNEMILIPSQRFLFLNMDTNVFYQKSIEDVQEFQSENHIENFKQGISESVFAEFSAIVVALAKQHIRDLSDYQKDEKKEHETTLEKINKIWKEIIPHIVFDFNEDSFLFSPKTLDGEIYEINEMSDGEKAIFYYIGNVLIARENSYIIVDEPENNLNTSTHNKLWDILEKTRVDCKFIYISHSIDFVQSRKQMQLIWMKKYFAPDNWEFEKIEDSNDLPTELILKIYGSTDIILFCEGDKDSADFKVYNSLFGQKFAITPVGGCEEVKKYTLLTNKLRSKINKQAIGIIDNDNRSKEEINRLKEIDIYITDFNEIEMLLCSDIVMYDVIKPFEENHDIIVQKIKKFQDDVFTAVEKNMEKIALETLAAHYNMFLSGYKVESKKSIIEFDKQVLSIHNNINHNLLYREIVQNITVSIDEKDFNSILKYCNLKEEVSKGIANNIVDSNYTEKALGVIKKNENVKKSLLDSFFMDIVKKY